MYDLLSSEKFLQLELLLVMLLLVGVLFFILFKCLRDYWDQISGKYIFAEKYKNRFMRRQRGKAIDGEILYLRKEQYRILEELVLHASEKRISIYSLLGNIVEDHLTVYAREIRELTECKTLQTDEE